MIEHVTEISIAQLLAETQQRSYQGYRFVTATCVDNGNETFDLLYHFDRDGELDHLRLIVGKDDSVPSVSQIYFCALLVENEMKELFGVNVTDIVIDYGGRMLLAEGAPTTPMAGGQLIIERR